MASADSGDWERQWERWQEKLQQRFGRKPDLNALLFLIGIQETGFRKTSFSKEEKMDLMHVGVCAVLSRSGYYRLDYIDEQGWPHWIADRPMPEMDAAGQEQLLKQHVVLYLEARQGPEG